MSGVIEQHSSRLLDVDNRSRQNRGHLLDLSLRHVVQYLPLSSVLRFRIVSSRMKQRGCSYYLVSKTTDSNWSVFQTCREISIHGSLMRLPCVLEGVECITVGWSNLDLIQAILDKTAPTMLELRVLRPMSRPSFVQGSDERHVNVVSSCLYKCRSLQSLLIDTRFSIRELQLGNLFGTLRELSLTIDRWDHTMEWLGKMSDYMSDRSRNKCSIVAILFGASFQASLPTRDDAESCCQRASFPGLSTMHLSRLTTLGFPDYIHRVLFKLFNPKMWRTTCRVSSVEEAMRFRTLMNSDSEASDTCSRLNELQSSDEMLAKIALINASALRSLFFTSSSHMCSSELANAIRNSASIRVFETNHSATYALYLPNNIEAFIVPHTVPAKTLFSTINPFAQDYNAEGIIQIPRPIARQKSVPATSAPLIYPIREAGRLTFDDDSELERLSNVCPNLERIVLRRTNELSIGVVARCVRRWKHLRKLHLLSDGNSEWVETILQMFDPNTLADLAVDVCSKEILSEVRRLRLCNVDFSCDIEMSPQWFVTFYSNHPELTIRATNLLPGKPMNLCEARSIALGAVHRRTHAASYFHDPMMLDRID